MATVIAHGHKDMASKLTINFNELPGLLIDCAELMGWNQGFDVSSMNGFIWQVNEAEVEKNFTIAGDAVWVQVSLSPQQEIFAPFAGITSLLEEVLKRANWKESTAFTFVFDSAQTKIKEPFESSFFDKLPLGKLAHVKVSCAIPSDKFEQGELIGFKVPEFFDIEWRKTNESLTTLSEWSALAVAGLAHQTLVSFIEQNCSTLVLLHIERMSE